MTVAKVNSISRREFVSASFATAAAASSVLGQKRSDGSKPNIIFILADDMGWGDLSCYGRPDYQTPHLDKLAREGIRFTNAYSAAPVCTPTRVGFHTGRYPARLAVGLEEPIHERTALSKQKLQSTGIPISHPTVSSLIRSAGYETALVGKWHLGYLPYFSPLKFGFDEFFGNMSGAVDHFTHRDMTNSLDMFEGEVPVEKIGYMTDLLTHRAVEYIRRPRSSPFYLSLHYTAPHWPWEGPKDLSVSKAIRYSPTGFRAGGSLRVYAEMMRSLDDGIGSVLSALKAAKIENETIVIFTSDNGGERFSFNWPFRGQKMEVFEGGVRVPAIVRWPGVTRPGTSTEQPVITMDWTATMIAAAGAKPDIAYPLDGEDLTAVLRSQRPLFDRTFFWRTKNQGAVRNGKWKYVRTGANEALFDLSIDEHEQADFQDAEPAVLVRLRDAFKMWESGMQRYGTNDRTT